MQGWAWRLELRTVLRDASRRSDPLTAESEDCSEAVEVMVVVQDREATIGSGGRDQRVRDAYAVRAGSATRR